MNERDLTVFIDGATNFFTKMSKVEATVGIPHIKSSDSAIQHGYTGVIGISGRKKGLVYFSAPEILLSKLLLSIGEQSRSKEILADLVGEVANTIAGNAREYFGSEFIISVPHVLSNAEDVKVPPTLRCYVIPIEWGGVEASVVISLEG